MVALAVLGALILEDPVAEPLRLLALAEPAALTVELGKPVPAPWRPESIESACWRTEGRRRNFTPDPGDQPHLLEGPLPGLAAADYRPVEGKTGISHRVSAAWLYRDGLLPKPSALFTDKLGLRTEIRFLIDPTSSAAGGDIPFRVYVDGAERRDVVAVVRPPDGKPAFVPSEGTILSFRVHQSGQWRVSASWVESKLQMRHAVVWFERGSGP